MFVVMARAERHPDMTPSHHADLYPVAVFHNRERAEGYAAGVGGVVVEVPVK